MAAWVGNAPRAWGNCFRRAVEKSIPARLKQWTTRISRLHSRCTPAAMGVPFMPTYTTLGTICSSATEIARVFFARE